jgi:hypothetical protein
MGAGNSSIALIQRRLGNTPYWVNNHTWCLRSHVKQSYVYTTLTYSYEIINTPLPVEMPGLVLPGAYSLDSISTVVVPFPSCRRGRAPGPAIIGMSPTKSVDVMFPDIVMGIMGRIHTLAGAVQLNVKGEEAE